MLMSLLAYRVLSIASAFDVSPLASATQEMSRLRQAASKNRAPSKAFEIERQVIA
jgi:hypothetical protein